MKKTQQQQYKYEEFDQHVSLWNIIPSGKGGSLVLLRKIIDGMQNNVFVKNPSILITGEGARTLAAATANTLCSGDIRIIEAKYLINTRTQMDFFGDNLGGTINIINSFERIGLNESVLWSLLKNRNYKFTSFDRKYSEYIYINGLVIITAQNIKSISSEILNVVDFKVEIEPYTQQQLELLVHQRLHFCGVDYNNDGNVLKAIVEHGNGQIENIIDFLKTCILSVQSENKNELTLGIVNKAIKLLP
jgi:hypothetical protein